MQLPFIQLGIPLLLPFSPPPPPLPISRLITVGGVDGREKRMEGEKGRMGRTRTECQSEEGEEEEEEEGPSPCLVPLQYLVCTCVVPCYTT